MFLNETKHPKADALYATLCLCAVRDADGSTDFYVPLENFRRAQNWSNEKAADLYARIEEGLTGFYKDGSTAIVTALSKFLWANDAAVVA